VGIDYKIRPALRAGSGSPACFSRGVARAQRHTARGSGRSAAACVGRVGGGTLRKVYIIRLCKSGSEGRFLACVLRLFAGRMTKSHVR